MILDSTTRKLQINLAGTVATNQCPVVVDYVDFTSSATTPGVQASTTNNATQVDILSAPAASTQRKVNNISFYNADTASVTVTIVLDDNGTDYQIINSMVLAVGDTLTYTDVDGWSVSSRTGGSAEALRSGWVQEFTANGTWVKPGNCRFFMVECVGSGGGGGGGEGSSSNAANRAGGGGGGGGKRNRALFLARDLPTTVSVTVGAQTSVASGGTNSAGSNGAGGNISSFGTYLYGYAGGGGAGGSTTAANTGSGGGGGGGTSSGSNATSSTGVLGGSAFAVSVASTSFSDHIGSPGQSSAGFASFLGGGGGAATAGGNSFFSAGGGGGGGNISIGTSTSAAGNNGGSCGGNITAVSGSGSVAGPIASAGSYGRIVPGYCGQGGAGGGSNGSGTGGRGGDGGFPGGGGGAGGAGNNTGGAGGRGAAGVVRVWGW